MATSADFQEMWQDHYLDSGNTMQTMMLTEEDGAKQISREEIRLLISALGGVKGKAILDLACGIGRFSRAFAARGATRVVGVDFVAEFIQGAKEFQSPYTPQIDFQHGNVLDVAVEGPFDVVFANWLCMYLSEEECHRLVRRVIRWFAGRPGRFLLRESCDPDDPELLLAGEEDAEENVEVLAAEPGAEDRANVNVITTEAEVELLEVGDPLVFAEDEEEAAAANNNEGEGSGVRLSEVSTHSVHPYYRPPQYYRDLMASHGFTLRREGHVEADEQWHGDRNQIYFVFSYPGRGQRPRSSKTETNDDATASAPRPRPRAKSEGQRRRPTTDGVTDSTPRRKDVPADLAETAQSDAAEEAIVESPQKRGSRRFFCCFGR
eukprot:TRINITY_DN2018_c0_g1_i1.p1 TRINITY_DN2018_c0_g1~~TRINITY_DN2018_c0_g1_i1.p1  ORF type:complete len:378 (-),score=72.83 TRINITY_DN2018_c0_g1_i1:1298-2431(-)